MKNKDEENPHIEVEEETNSKKDVKKETKLLKEITRLENKLLEKDQKHLERIKELEGLIHKCSTDRDHWKNEYYRAYADTQNLRKSLENDKKQFLKYRLSSFIEDLLPILDSYEIVLKTAPQDEVIQNYLIGFQFLFKNLNEVLENEGLKLVIPTIGKAYDPNVMEAVETVVDDKHPNLVKEVKLTGYMLYDRVIRPSKVVVSIKESDKLAIQKEKGE